MDINVESTAKEKIIEKKKNQNEINGPQGTCLIQFMFLLFGVASLLAWNAILTELTFLDLFVHKLNPFTTVSFLNFAPNIILQFILLWKKNIFKLKTQIVLGLVSSIVLLIALPTLIILFKNHEIINIIITVVLILIMGLINALLSSGLFAFTSFFPLEMIVVFSAGQAISGIILNVIMYIIIPLVTYDDIIKKEIIKAIIFFGISALIIIICFICYLSSLKMDYFKYYLKNNKDETEVGRILNEEEYGEMSKEESSEYNLKEAHQNVTFLEMFKILMDIDLLCVFIYIVTFALYPVAMESQKIFDLGEYNYNTILTIYNVSDALGRFLISKIKPNKKITYITVLSRSILLVTIILNYYLQQKDVNLIFTSIFLIINDSLLGLSNGIGTTLCFGIAPTLVNDDLKGQAGASVSFFTIVGIFLGALCQFLTKKILNSLSS